MASWMRFDPRDVSTFEVSSLDITAFGLLMWMACESWKNGGIPDDPGLLRRLLRSRMDGVAFDDAWRQVRPLLDQDTDGKLRIPWVEEARVELIAGRKNDAERQRNQRLRAREGRTSRVTHADVHVSHTGVTGESRSTDGRTEKTDEEDEQQKSAVGAAAAPPAVRKPRAEPTGPDAEFRKWWLSEFEAVTGNPYAWNFRKDSALASRLLKSVGLEETRARAMRLLHAPPEWMVDKGGGVDIGTLSSQFNKLASAGKLTATNNVREAVIQSQDPRTITKPLFLPAPKQGR